MASLTPLSLTATSHQIASRRANIAALSGRRTALVAHVRALQDHARVQAKGIEHLEVALALFESPPSQSLPSASSRPQPQMDSLKRPAQADVYDSVALELPALKKVKAAAEFESTELRRLTRSRSKKAQIPLVAGIL